MIQVSVERPVKAFLPEAYAYYSWFQGQPGFEVVWDSDEAADGSDVDVRLLFRPWRHRRRKSKLLMVDRASVSVTTARFARDLLKSYLSLASDIVVRVGEAPTGRLTRNGVVVERNMGYFPEFVVPRRSKPDFWGVYSGEVARPGVRDKLLQLANLGGPIVVCGAEADFAHHPNLHFTGRISLREVYAAYANAHVGLNIVPSTGVYANQQSTKLVEYCAAGLSVLSTSHPWSQRFLRSRSTPWVDFDQFVLSGGQASIVHEAPDVSDLAWSRIIEQLGLAALIQQRLPSVGCSRSERD